MSQLEKYKHGSGGHTSCLWLGPLDDLVGQAVPGAVNLELVPFAGFRSLKCVEHHCKRSPSQKARRKKGWHPLGNPDLGVGVHQVLGHHRCLGQLAQVEDHALPFRDEVEVPGSRAEKKTSLHPKLVLQPLPNPHQTTKLGGS